jgi:hypothetical protein
MIYIGSVEVFARFEKPPKITFIYLFVIFFFLNTRIEIPPNWKRKHKIILEAHFNSGYNKEGNAKENIAISLWKIGLFN